MAQTPKPHIVHASASSESSASTVPRFPLECQHIVQNALAGSTYPMGSTARVFSIWCPEKDAFADCLNRNLAELGTNSYLPYGLLANNFDKDVLKNRLSAMCTTLPSVATDLKCLSRSKGMGVCYGHYRMSVMKAGLTLGQLCRNTETFIGCFRTAATGTCTTAVIDFFKSFMYKFIPAQCQIP